MNLREALHWKTIQQPGAAELAVGNEVNGGAVDSEHSQSTTTTDSGDSARDESNSSIETTKQPDVPQQQVVDTYEGSDPLKTKCINMKDQYFVIPGSSWGSLTLEMQRYVSCAGSTSILLYLQCFLLSSLQSVDEHEV